MMDVRREDEKHGMAYLHIYGIHASHGLCPLSTLCIDYTGIL